MNRVEQFIDRADDRADTKMAVMDYGFVLRSVFERSGKDIYDADKAVNDIKASDIPAFEARATELVDYRSRITEKPDGISVEMFNHAIRVDPAKVLADSMHWAKLKDQLD